MVALGQRVSTLNTVGGKERDSESQRERERRERKRREIGRERLIEER